MSRNFRYHFDETEIDLSNTEGSNKKLPDAILGTLDQIDVSTYKIKL